MLFIKLLPLVLCTNSGHWNLLILCHFGEMNRLRTRRPCMLLLDSLLGLEPKRLEPDIRRFIYFFIHSFILFGNTEVCCHVVKIRFVFDIFESEGRNESRKCISDIPLLVPKVSILNLHFFSNICFYFRN